MLKESQYDHFKGNKTPKKSNNYIEVLSNILPFLMYKIEPKRKITLEELHTQDISTSYKRQKISNDVNSSTNEYYRTKTPVNESKGELIDEFITPDVNSELEISQQNGKHR